MDTEQVLFERAVPVAGIASDVRSVVRHPILDVRGRVSAFELICRPEAYTEERVSVDPTGFLQTAAGYRLDRASELKKLTGGLPVFVQCPDLTVGQRISTTLPPNLTFLGLPDTIEATEEHVSLCKSLKDKSIRLVLHLTSWNAALKPLIDLADILAVDFAVTAEVRTILAGVRGASTPLLAKNVHTQEQRRRAQEAGFTLFEGHYFCQPMLQRNRRPPANQLLRIELLKALQAQPLDVGKIGDLVKRDGPLAYQVLRIANSPAWGISQEIRSIEHALLTIGDDRFRRIATTAIATEFNGGQPAELLCMAMIRARFCEEAGSLRGLDGFTQYLLGLLSLLPAMQGQAMADLVPSLPLSENLREALLGKQNEERVLLSWIEHVEHGDWAACDQCARNHGLDRQRLSNLYVESVAWAEATIRSSN